MLTNTTKFNVAAMFHSTTVKHAAKKNLNTMKLTTANAAKKWFMTLTANTFQATTGSMFAAMQTAQHHAQTTIIHKDNLLRAVNSGRRTHRSPAFFLMRVFDFKGNILCPNLG